MRDALYGVLRSRHALMAICISVGFLAASAPARAASGPVRASSLLVVKKHTTAQPPLELADLERDLAAVVGVPVRISCDDPGVPSPLDGRTIEPGNDGQVFWTDDTQTTIGNVIHVWTQECWDARQAKRNRSKDAPSYFTFEGRRIDNQSGPPFLVLLHEAFHIAYQSTDEGRVECAAVSNAWPLVRTLGLPAWQAAMMLSGMQYRHAQFTPEGSPQYRTVC